MGQWFRKLLCGILGHKKPYIEKMTCTLCSRCSIVIDNRMPLKYSVKLKELKKKSDRIKKHGF